MNPISKEEWKRIKELLEKEELTLEEALELRELARKVTDEHGDRPEAWRLHAYASMMVGYALRKMKEKEEREKGTRVCISSEALSTRRGFSCFSRASPSHAMNLLTPST